MNLISGHFVHFSADRFHSSKAADEIGQEWICDCWGFNRLMNDMDLEQRAKFTEKLIQNYDPKKADRSYISGLTNEDANHHLKPV